MSAPGAEWGGLGRGALFYYSYNFIIIILVPGGAAGSVPPSGTTVTLQDTAELHGKEQFPGCDTAACHEFKWHKYAAVIPVCTACHRFLWEAGAVHPPDMAFVAAGGGRLYPAGWIELTARTACHGSWGQGVVGAFGELLWLQSNASSLRAAALLSSSQHMGWAL